MRAVFGAMTALCFLVLSTCGVLAQSGHGLAASLPLADIHMHLRGGRDASFYLDQMNRHQVRWGGAVGGGPRDRVLEIKAALKGRYIAALGQTEFFSVLFASGEQALTDPDHPVFQRLFAEAEPAFRNGLVRGFGEIHINNISPFSPGRGQRRIALETPVVMKMFGFAQAHGGFVQIHTMASSGMDEVMRVAARFPRARMILSHCLPGASTQQLDQLFRARPNIFCELSAQGPTHRIERVYGKFGLREHWRQLIEAHPTRIMVGTDPCCGLEDRYDEMIAEIRQYLLPGLSPATMRRVAYQNAQQIFGLQ